MLNYFKTHRLTTALLGIPLAELIHHLPSADQLTTWLKLLIQILLLITAIHQLRNTVLNRGHKNEDPPPEEED